MKKKITAFVAAIVIAFTAMVTFVSAKTVKAGDVSGDGKITASDARKVLRAAAGLETLDNAQLLTADINTDGKITASDARKILRAAAGLEALGDITSGEESESESDVFSVEIAIDSFLNSQTLADSQKLYEEFMCTAPEAPVVDEVLSYYIEDFDGAKVKCMLVHISASVAYWTDKEAQMGGIEDSVYLMIDLETKTVYDSLSTDALNCEHDTSTAQGRATYLMWMYNSMLNGSDSEYFVNDSEIVFNTKNTIC